MDLEIQLINVQAKAEANQRNNMALVGKLDGQQARVELVEKGAERRDREVINLRAQMNQLSEQITALQLAIVESRTHNGSEL